MHQQQWQWIDMEAHLPLNEAVLPLPDAREREIRQIVPAFLARCRANRILEVRIVHGTTDPATARILHTVLKELPEVACFRSGGLEAAATRATTVVLLAPEEWPPRDRHF